MKQPQKGFLYLLLTYTLLSFSAEKQALPPFKIKLQLISRGFTSPVGMASPQDGTNRLFVIEQGGKIKIIKDEEVLPTPFINLSNRLDGLNIAYSEKGLLGLVFH